MNLFDSKDVLLNLKDRALDAALEGITIADAGQENNPLIYVNHGFEILTGYTASEVLGKNCHFLQGPDTQTHSIATIKQAIQSQRPCVVEILNYKKGGTPFWNRLSITPVQNETGQTTHFIGIQSDVTARRAAEEKLLSANETMQQALDAAAVVQRSLLPHQLPAHPHVDVAWRFEPCATLAGDILNVFWLNDRRLACYVLDVVGHGVAAALLSFTLSHTLSLSGQYDLTATHSPAQIATHLNERFPFENERQQFFTLLYGILDVRDQTFEYVSAGHPPLLHMPAKGTPQISSATGFPVGVVASADYENHTIHLRPGDRLYLYSDGVIEAGELSGRPWGIQGLCDFAQAQKTRSLSDILDLMVTEARVRHQESILADDLSILAIELTGT